MAQLPAPLTRGKPPTRRELTACLNSPDAATLSAVRAALKAPVDLEWLAGRVMTARRHYSASQADDRVDAAMMDDWLDIIGGFPHFAVDEAFRGWLRDESFPPTPAGIKARCVAAMSEVRAELAKVATPKEAPSQPNRVTPEKMREIVRDAYGDEPVPFEALRRLTGE